MEHDMVDVHEAEANLEDLIERVEHGARITITNAGQPVAALIPPEDRGIAAAEVDR